MCCNSMTATWARLSADIRAHLEAVRLSPMDVPGDGNCLFTASAMHLGGGDHRITRAQVVDYIHLHDPQFKGLIQETLNPDQSWALYLDALSQERTWAGEECLVALAKCFQRRVFVISAAQETRVFCYFPDGSLSQQLPVAQFLDTDILLLYNGLNHYDALIRGAAGSGAESPQKRPPPNSTSPPPQKRSHEEYDVPEIPYEELLPLLQTERIGVGTYGEVFCGTWRTQRVAVKRLLCKLSGDLHEEFLAELSILKRLRGHPQITVLLGATSPNQSPCLVFEYAEGGSLHDAIHVQHAPINELQIALDIASGLAFLHSQSPPIWHRDLKSPNVLLDKQRTRAKLCDFGMARIKLRTASTLTRNCGTPNWMAPELMDAKNPYNSAIDVYSFGCILYEMTTRSVPWADLSQVQIMAEVYFKKERPKFATDHSWKQLIERCLAYDARSRPTIIECQKHLQGEAKDPAVTSAQDDDLRRELKRHFGFDNFRDGQLTVLHRVMMGRNAMAVFATGAGKSLLYWLPSQLLPGLTVVISPLTSLAIDQVDKLRRLGIAAALLDSSVKPKQAMDIWHSLRTLSTKILYLSPERFLNEATFAHLQCLPLSLIVVDEAHCVWRWGPRFRPDYLRLRDAIKEFRNVRFLALTATATKSVIASVCEQFSVDTDCVELGSFERPNLILGYTRVFSDEQRITVLLQKLHQQNPSGPTIIYCATRNKTEELAELLRNEKYDARSFHAGMKREERQRVQEWFMNEQLSSGIVCATIAFGMGVDKRNVRYIYHCGLPSSLEGYAQEIGRAGRDGLLAFCEAIVLHGRDQETLEYIISEKETRLESVETLLKGHVFCGPSGVERMIQLAAVSKATGVPELSIRIILVHLELDDKLLKIRSANLNETYKIAPIDGDWSQEPWFSLVKFGVVKRKLLHVTLGENVAERGKFLKEIAGLEENKKITVTPEGTMIRFQLLGKPNDERIKELSKREQDSIAKSCEGDREEVVSVLRVLEGDRCVNVKLREYFGDPSLEVSWRCGSCHVCQRKQHQQ